MAAPAHTQDFDAIVIGAGMAGTSLAAALCATHRVVLVEAEEQAGYHSTGRSAAMWILNYGPPDVRALTGLSRPSFEAPPPGFSDGALMARRPVAFLARADQRDAMSALLAEGHGLRVAPIDEIRGLVPALRPAYAAAVVIEDDAFDLDVAAIHQGFLRRLRAGGGRLALRSRAGRIERSGGGWEVEANTGDLFRAPVVVNAAGAWADELAALAGAAPLGLVPCRRTAAVIDPAPFEPRDWPMLIDVGHGWYCRAEARTRLLVSPADETPTHPHDVQPDELDVALAIDRMQQALAIQVQRVEHAWAGLRTFTPDGSLAIGWDGAVSGFFWCAGQGGYGIQTAPAAGQLAADLIAGRDPGSAAPLLPMLDPRRFARVALARTLKATTRPGAASG